MDMTKLGGYGIGQQGPKSATVELERPETLSNVQHDTLAHMNTLSEKMKEIRNRITGPEAEKADTGCPTATGNLYEAMTIRGCAIGLNNLADQILRSL